MRKICCFLAAICLLFGLPRAVKATAPKEYHWYCIGNKEHRQIRAAPELSFVEDYGGYYIDHRHHDENKEKVIYLTFDAGYENGNVARILDVLRDTETPAAFFVLAHLVKQNGDLILRMKKEGHLVCNHTARHRNLSNASEEAVRDELLDLEEHVKQVCGEGCAPYFRPPEGSFSPELLRTVQEMGYQTVFWSFAYDDWDNGRQMKPEAALAKIRAHMHNGAVLLLHPTSATNAAILKELIEGLRAEGYRFGTLEELCQREEV